MKRAEAFNTPKLMSEIGGRVEQALERGSVQDQALDIGHRRDCGRTRRVLEQREFAEEAPGLVVHVLVSRATVRRQILHSRGGRSEGNRRGRGGNP